MRAARPFWSRQFDAEPTTAQAVFDVLFGLALPVVCLAADPVVFAGEAFLGGYAAGAYALIGLELLVLSGWLLLRRRLGPAAAWFAGPLLAGGAFALVLGAVLLPLTLIGLFFLIGILGFTPWATGFVFVRNGIRAFRQAAPFMGGGRRALLAAAGVLVVILPGAALDHHLARVVDRVVARPAVPPTRLEKTLFRRLPDRSSDPIAWACSREEDPARRRLLAEAYRQLTGRDVKERLAILND